MITSAAISQQQLKVPAPSPSTTVKQDFGTSSVELSYSRPGVKGRKIFGDLVPYDKVWRTGANSATTITFGDDVTINIVDNASKKLVWQGWAETEVTRKKIDKDDMNRIVKSIFRKLDVAKN